jgi:hypothetical protein
LNKQEWPLINACAFDYVGITRNQHPPHPSSVNLQRLTADELLELGCSMNKAAKDLDRADSESVRRYVREDSQ